MITINKQTILTLVHSYNFYNAGLYICNARDSTLGLQPFLLSFLFLLCFLRSMHMTDGIIPLKQATTNSFIILIYLPFMFTVPPYSTLYLQN
jgi:hypothetical protein